MERKIEKLLRAYAQKRRADAGEPFALHPATRRLLQGEVARRAPRRGERNLFAVFLGAFRRRLVFALCIVAMAFIAAGLLLPALSAAKSKARRVTPLASRKD